MSAEDSKSAARLIADIVGNVQDIMRAEVQLAAREIRDEAIRLRRIAVLSGAAALVAVLGLGWLLFAFIQMLALTMSLWSAALIVSAATLVIACGLALAARSLGRKAASPMPRTRAAVQEMTRWTEIREPSKS
jgi:uncharacterized membrane protein